MPITRQCCLACVIIGLLSLWNPPTAQAFAIHPLLLPPASMSVLNIAQTLVIAEQDQPAVSPPIPIQKAIFQDLAPSTRPLKIIEATQQTWPDGCLGLSTPDMLCTMALVPGWQVIVTDGSQKWTYRTDEFGEIIKLAAPTDSK